MSKSLYKKVYIFILLAILSTSILQCTTLEPQDTQKKQQQMLSTQKDLIISFLDRGLPAVALKEAKGALHTHPDNPDIQNLTGLCYLALQKPDQANTYFSRAYETKPSLAFGLNKSSALIESKRYRTAHALLQELRKTQGYETYPYPERIAHNLGLLFERTGQTKTAIKHYQDALSFAPSFYNSLLRLAHLQRQSQNHNQAITNFKKAQQSCQICYDPIHGLALTFLEQGHKAQAAAVLTTYLSGKGPESHKKRAQSLLKLATQ